MSIPDELNKVSTAIKNTSEIVKVIYKDLAQPSLIKIGTALETVFDLSNTILLPIKLANEKSKVIFTRNMERYKNKIEHIDSSEIIQVPPEIGIPIIDKLTYTEDFYISEMYLNLLASASSKTYSSTAHPSYIRIIESLSPDEAKIILYLTDKYFEIFDKNIKYIYYTATRLDQSGNINLTRKLTGLEFSISLQFKNNIQLYLDNFIGLGLLIDKEQWYLASSYDEIIELYKYLSDEFEKPDFKTKFKSVELKKSYFSITDYGEMFINSCSFNFRQLLTKGAECLKASKYNDAIHYFEELLNNDFPYSLAILNLLELYLLTVECHDIVDGFSCQNIVDTHELNLAYN